MAELHRSAVLYAPWRIVLLGTLRAEQDDVSITRFRTRNAGLLLAYLACHPHQSHPRETLLELLWPECDPASGRNRLKQELSSLRRQLEPPRQMAGSVLIADRTQVRLNSQTAISDVTEFEAAVQDAAQTGDLSRKIARLTEAASLYGGPLLPGSYEDWVLTRRTALQEAYLAVLRSLTQLSEEAGELSQALTWASRAVVADPLREEAHTDLIRLHIALEQTGAARQQYETLKHCLRRELGVSPSAATQALAESLLGSRSVPPREQSPSAVGETPPMAFTNNTFPNNARSSSCRPRLPMQFTRFFGREHEQTQLIGLLTEARLVTLYGMGGSGKTRLAIETAQQIAPTFGGSVVFVELAGLSEARLIADAVADALGLPRAGRRDPLVQIASALASTPTLLVLDNLEQMAEEAGPVLQALLRQVQAVTCLITSRQTLGISAECPFFLPPLPVPARAESPARLLQTSSVQLFVDRAQVALPDFQITPRNAAAIAAICEQLEGIPLALELAAAWSPLLTPRQMQARLTARFALLTSRRQDLPERHRTLWAAVQWSYDLLTPDLQTFLVRLSLFRGGWTVEAAQEVCLEVCAESNGLAALAALHQRALITTENAEDSRRGRMLETLREFAEAHLTAEDREETCRRHCRFFVRLAETTQPYLNGPEQEIWLDQLERDHDNLRAALAWCEAHEEAAMVATGLHFMLSLGGFWSMRGHQKEGRDQFRRFLAHPAASEFAAEDLARASLFLGDLAREQGDFTDAVACARQSLALSRACGSIVGAASALRLLGLGLNYLNDPAGATLALEESVLLFRQTEDSMGLAYALLSLSILTQQRGELDRAELLCTETLALAKKSGNKRATADALNILGLNSHERGDFGTALSRHAESLAIQRTLNNKRGMALSLHNLAWTAIGTGDDPSARHDLELSLRLFQEIGERWGMEIGLTTLAALSTRSGQFRLAARLWAAVASLKNDTDLSSFSSRHRKQIADIRAELGERAFASEWFEGLALSPEEAIAAAFSPQNEISPEKNF